MMKFQEVPNKIDFPKQELELLRFWKEVNALKNLKKLHENDPHWSFIDGPITANNPMGVHHGWGRTYKDLFNRFWTMQGHKLRYQNGFDCQGLWVEVEVEKEMGFQTKKDIEDFGLEKFVRKCKARVLRYAAIQTEQSIRLGYWMDWNDPDQLRWLADMIEESPEEIITVDGVEGSVTGTVDQIVGKLGLEELGGSYFTFSNENNYMIWTFLKKCQEKGWLYRGADVMPWCPRCATGISQHEIVTDGYAELTHDSVILRFPLRQENGEPRKSDGLQESLLVWTTTPWTLTSNVAAAVGPELTYAKVRQGNEILYLSKETKHLLKGDYEILDELKGLEMEGWRYNGPFDELPAAQKPGGLTELKELIREIETNTADIHQVILWAEVGETEGTGIVHIAPGCGAEDFQLGLEHHFPMIAPLDEEGVFIKGFDWLTGMEVSDVAKPIFENLKEKGLLYQVEPYTHRYPTCWRCKTELVFRLVDEWFISMGEKYNKPREEVTPEEKERSLRYQIMDVVDQIRWIPEFGFSREMDWLNNMHDWMISKKRFWGLALPIWVCEDCEEFNVIGDEKELKSRAISGWENFEGHSPHRPQIDAIKLKCPKCSGTMHRIPDVGNPWLDAGIVPFSTLRYRTDNDYWKSWYPAQWISESFPGQFRNWFYSLLAMATVIDNSPPFLENFGYGTLLAEDGRPMHKSWGNSIEFNEAADKMGVDVMRWLYLSQKPENDLLFGFTRGDETRRQYLIPLWNVYSFFITYANLDGWNPSLDDFDPDYPEGDTPQSENLLDRWILARLNNIIPRITDVLKNSDSMSATIELNNFLDDLSNWYVRRSRRRFWKSEHDTDKNSAYATLYHILVKLIRILAPFTPFVTEAMYQNLIRSVHKNARESVHQTLWLQADHTAVDNSLLEQMGLVRQIAGLGLSARNGAGLKVRQPLNKALAYAGKNRSLDQEFIDIIKDELNVKQFELVDKASDLVTYIILPDNKTLGPRFGSDFPKIRAALSEADPIEIASAKQSGASIKLFIDEKTILLDSNEVLVQTEPLEGLVEAHDKLVTVAIDTKITPELHAEGLAREIVRRVQAMRKDADFDIADRIITYYQTEEQLSAAIQKWKDYISLETLSIELLNKEPPSDSFVKSHNIDGKNITIGVEKSF
jgi:isoleucyl-tRNA synthetase